MAKSDGKKAGGGAAGGLERDFGYLMPFFDKVAQQAGSLAPPAREEALRLIAGEKERWARVRSLLSGAAAAPAPAPTSRQRAPSGTARDLTGRNAPTPAAAPERARRGFTVGPLRDRKG